MSLKLVRISRIEISWIQHRSMRIQEFKGQNGLSCVYHCKSALFAAVSPEETQTSFRHGIQMPLACTHNCSASNDEILNCGILFFYVLSRNVGEGLNLYVKYHTTKSRSICFKTKFSSSQSAGIWNPLLIISSMYKVPVQKPNNRNRLKKLYSWVMWFIHWLYASLTSKGVQH